MFVKCAKKTRWTVQMGVDVKRCAECGKHERPCLVDGKPAIFHRWVEEDKALLRIDRFMKPEDQARAFQLFNNTGVADASSTIEKLRVTFALVEYPDGSVGKVKPELVTFLDRKEG